MSYFCKPDPNHKLFTKLVELYPIWWQNLINDKELYINIRQDNHINVYYHGGSLLNLEYATSFKAKISYEYIPLLKNKDYVSFVFGNNSNIEFPKMETMQLNNFGDEVLQSIKKRISKFYGTSSEKGIQADFVLKNDSFIDTEFQPVSSRKNRFDLIWVEVARRKIFMVELKTIKDSRLMFDSDRMVEHETVDKVYRQLAKYYEFVQDHKEDLIEYYKTIFQIEKKLGILPGKLKGRDNLDGFEVESKPILLVGDCNQRWINKNAERINSKLKDIAFGCFYQGKATREFKIPEKREGYRYIL